MKETSSEIPGLYLAAISSFSKEPHENSLQDKICPLHISVKSLMKGTKPSFLPKSLTLFTSDSALFSFYVTSCQLLKMLLGGFAGRKKTLRICAFFCLSIDGGRDSLAFHSFRPEGLQPHWLKSVCTVIPTLYQDIFIFYSLKNSYRKPLESA